MGGGVVCTVIFVSNQPVVLGCVGVGVLTIEEPVPMAQDNRKGKQEENQEGCNKKTKKTISQSFQIRF